MTRVNIVSFREKERKVGPDGFVDSSKYKNSYVVSNEKKEKKDSGGHSGKGGKSRTSVVDMAAKKEKDEKDYDKRIKLIEVSKCNGIFRRYEKKRTLPQYTKIREAKQRRNYRLVSILSCVGVTHRV